MPMLFPYTPDWASQLEEAPRVRVTKFGDGYEQRAEDGINTNLQKWAVRFQHKTKSDADQIVAFLRAHGAWNPFDFTVPNAEWSATDSGIGIGNGSQVQYQLQVPELLNKSEDWQGSYPVYTAPRTNYIAKSEDASSWTPETAGTGVAAVITSNVAVAPDGTLTADQIILNLNGGTTSSDISGIRMVTAGAVPPWVRKGESVTFSCWMKTADGSTKVVGFEPYSGINLTKTVNGVWTRYTVTYTLSFEGEGNVYSIGYILLRGNYTSISGNATIHVWGAQFEVGSSATRYIPNTTTGSLESTPGYWPTAGGGFRPVKDWSASPTIYKQGWQGKVKLRSEPRKNYVLHNRDQSNAVWSKNAVNTTINTVASPDGLAVDGGDTIQETTANDLHYTSQLLTGAQAIQSGINHVFSIFARINSGSRRLTIQHRNKDNVFVNALFDLSTGTVVSSSGSALVSASIVKVPGIPSVGAFGWFRCILVASSGWGATSPNVAYLMTNGTSTTYTGDGSSSLWLWGAQVEEGSEVGDLIYTTGSVLSVTDYSLSSSGLLTLVAAPRATEYITFDGSGTTRKKMVCRSWSKEPIAFNCDTVNAVFEEVLG